MSKMLGFVGCAVALGALGMGCDSNPTPHPQADATADTRLVDTMAPNGEGPDEDHDGVADCTAAGGYWDGDACSGAVAASDAAEADAMSLDAADGAELQGGADAADGDDASGDASDSGPDAHD